MSKRWPPLITDAARPHWSLWRDRILTILVWVFFLLLFTEQWLVFQARLKTYFSTPGASWEFLMGPFVAVVGIMVAWLLFSAVFTYKRAIRARREHQPPPLPLEVEAAHFGIEPAELAAARNKQIIAVAVEPDGQLRFEEIIYMAAAAGRDRPAPALPDH